MGVGLCVIHVCVWVYVLYMCIRVCMGVLCVIHVCVWVYCVYLCMGVCVILVCV